MIKQIDREMVKGCKNCYLSIQTKDNKLFEGILKDFINDYLILDTDVTIYYYDIHKFLVVPIH